ncbi:unnamed protein product [Prorocentrum cordatum]|uniref:Uncharacterized protein n=1 Tax=Prorocentrum cordatum TaxID=2364126 RepID=A0ABN9T759_9DINO|nr:unnamed protein product [Polarella glacialis]
MGRRALPGGRGLRSAQSSSSDDDDRPRRTSVARGAVAAAVGRWPPWSGRGLGAQPSSSDDGGEDDDDDDDDCPERSSEEPLGGAPLALLGVPLVPPASLRLDLAFWAQLLDRAGRLGYVEGGAGGVRTAVFRRLLRRLTLVLEVEGLDDPAWERALQADAIGWAGVRRAFEQGFSPRVRLSRVERFSLSPRKK